MNLNSEAGIFLVFETSGTPAKKIMLVRRFGSGIYHEFSSLAKLQGLNHSNLFIMRMKIKVFQCFSWRTKLKKQHGRTQMLWSPVVQVLVGGGGHLGSNCCFPQWGPAANIWAQDGDGCLCCQLVTPGLWLVPVSWWDSVHFCIIL